MSKCSLGCKWWSELLAESRAGKVWAMCLAPMQKRQYTPPWHGCKDYQSGAPVDLSADDTEDDEPYCSCPVEHDDNEQGFNVCSACGKQIE